MRPRTLVILLLLTLCLEIGVRLNWDKTQGTPGLVLGHPSRVEILAPDYTGYFAGQPLHINHLGFRDDREYAWEKPPGTFRIFILGDSVGFGHGVKFTETWGYFLEQRLKAWRPDIRWEIWNLSVPGYDPTLKSRALTAYAEANPDLVIYSWFSNDLHGREYAGAARGSLATYKVKWFLKTHFYLYSQIKIWVDELAMAKFPNIERPDLREAKLLAAYEEKDPVFEPEKFVLKHLDPKATRAPISKTLFKPTGDDFAFTDRVIRKMKDDSRTGLYPMLFFINDSGEIDEAHDQFIAKEDLGMDRFFQKYLSSDGADAVSAYDAFWAYRPSEVPGSNGHSKAPANYVKAEVIFRYMSQHLNLFRKSPSFKGTHP